MDYGGCHEDYEMNPKDLKMASVFASNDVEAAKALADFLIKEGAMKVIERDGQKAYSVHIYSPSKAPDTHKEGE
jgi:hypothetical protein